MKISIWTTTTTTGTEKVKVNFNNQNDMINHLSYCINLSNKLDTSMTITIDKILLDVPLEKLKKSKGKIAKDRTVIGKSADEE